GEQVIYAGTSTGGVTVTGLNDNTTYHFKVFAYNNCSGPNTFETIGLGASNSLLGRLGARLQFTSKDGDQLIQPYARANIWSTMSGANNSVDYGGVDQIQTKAGGKWGQIGVGITAKVTKSASLYANIDGMFKVGGKDQSHTGVQAGAGFRANW
ncbi:MAG: autotransporter outer membrane beta-barrel domain-containing protein, partial [Glaciimonas sp.]|nr:autotransporter outer membrane beta-barrel domain-containing protein [Glaciimonas sp.]